MAEPHHEVQLLYAWRNGDRQAADELMRLHYRRVFAFFQRRIPAAAEDLTQRTFLACIEARDRVHASSLRAYLFGVAHRLLNRHLREVHRDGKLSSFRAPQPQSILTPSGMVSLRQEHWLLLRALERLSEGMQAVVALHYIEGLRAREVADVLEMSVTTVTTRLARARAALQQQVESMRAPPNVREAVAGSLEQWMQSLAPLAPTGPGDG